MPELPEVQTLQQELSKVIVGKKITLVEVRHPLVVRQPGARQFIKGLQGVTIRSIRRKAKILIFELSNGRYLTVHLKMTGQLVYPGGGAQARVVFHFSDGTALDFNDQRLFGELRLVDDWQTLAFVQKLGPEPFDLTSAQFTRMLARKKSKIKPLLMDQAFIAGIGNLYAAEALFCARIHPEKCADKLSAKEKTALFRHINAVLHKAILCGGSSVDNYVRLSGKAGGYSAYHKVYNRLGKSCLRCSAKIERIKTQGRGTYFCPRCQKKS